MSRERVAGVVIVLAGIYIFVQPLRDSPWTCLSSGILKLTPEGFRFCGWLPAFVLGSIVGAGLLIYGAWLLSTSRATAAARRQGFVAVATLAVVVGVLVVNFSLGPFSPLYSPTPMPTAAPARFAPAPTR